jgi:Mlc titration factor MtfA (ptsG expression regulator)
MFQYFRDWRNRRIIQRSTITTLQWDTAFAALPLLAGMQAAEKARLRELAVLFMYHKVFVGAHDVVVTESMALIIALQACLPVLNLGLDCYDGWTSVIVYPAGFAPKRIYTDEYGVEHHVQSDLSGESWLRGPVILSWNATEHAGMIDGSNLVIHEFAHKLDMQNGAANGYPPLHADMEHGAWLEAFSAGFEDFQHKCETGQHMGIDCYGASSPAEFFAVLSEVFFERPAVLQQHYAAIYEQLRQYYRQDLLARFS